MGATPQLLGLLDQESGAFQKLDHMWRPKNLFMQIQTQELMKDMFRRYEAVKASEGEFVGLERADIYKKLVRRLGFILRRAKFVRQNNQLAFGQAVSEYYTTYGQILRYLKIDQARGRLQSAPPISV